MPRPHQFATLAPLPHPSQPEPDLTQSLLDAAGPLGRSHALVIGHDTLDVLCSLIRRGCGAAAEMGFGGRLPAEPTEIVLVPRIAHLDEAAAAIRLARRTLLPCGRIVLHDSEPRRAATVMRLLRDAGFSGVRSRAGEGMAGAIITADWPMFGLKTRVMPRIAHGASHG